MASIHNDNDPPVVQAQPDRACADGQAAMLLVESLIHGMLARSLISAADAVEIAETAVEVQADLTHDNADHSATAGRSSMLLERVARSLRTDLPQV